VEASETDNTLRSLELAYSSAQDKLRFQSEQWNAIDNKNSVVLAVYGIAVAVFLTGDLKAGFVPYDKPIVFIWLLSILLGMACSLISLWPKTIDMPPNLKILVDKYLNLSPEDTKKHLLSSMMKSIEGNNRIIERKALLLTWSIRGFLPISLCLSALSIFIKDFMKG
jgi:hypothetical protein